MKDIIFEENKDLALSRPEIILFKYLNANKKNLRTKKEFIDAIKDGLSMVGKSEEESLAYYYAYTANYRPNGDYENLTKSEFKDYKTFKQKKTTNVDSSQFVAGKIPFKGSNLEGFWDINSKNDWYYVVESYGWYPIYLFINNKWYEVSDSYSSSTSKQLSQSRPSRYSIKVKTKIYYVSRKEMKDLRDGVIDFNDLMKGKKSTLEKTLKEKLLDIPKFISWGYGEDSGKAKFKLTDIKEVDEKILITVEILEAGKREGQKLVKSDVSYTTGQIPGATPNKVESVIKDKINREFVDIIGQYVDEDEELPQDYFLMFKFKHKD